MAVEDEVDVVAETCREAHCRINPNDLVDVRSRRPGTFAILQHDRLAAIDSWWIHLDLAHHRTKIFPGDLFIELSILILDIAESESRHWLARNERFRRRSNRRGRIRNVPGTSFGWATSLMSSDEGPRSDSELLVAIRSSRAERIATRSLNEIRRVCGGER